MKRNKTKFTQSGITLFGSFLILFGFFLLSYDYIQSKRLLAYEYMDRLIYRHEQQENVPKDHKVKIKTEEVKEEGKGEENASVVNHSQKTSYQYIGYLEIPKINLRKGIVDKNSKDNNVDRNLYIAKESTYPDVEKGNLIIAGHSGSGYNAFFKNLYKLSLSDKAIVKYQGKKYTYQVTDIYEQEKTGTIAIHRNYEKTALTLVTCTKDNDQTQTIYILEQIKIT